MPVGKAETKFFGKDKACRNSGVSYSNESATGKCKESRKNRLLSGKKRNNILKVSGEDALFKF